MLRIKFGCTSQCSDANGLREDQRCNHICPSHFPVNVNFLRILAK
jgi:hypothetical protein